MEPTNERSEKAGERWGWRIGTTATGLVAVLTLGAGAILSPVGASTFHDTWGHDLIHALAAPRSHATPPHRTAATAPAPAAASPPSLADQIRAQNAPRTGGNAAAVLAALNQVRVQFGLAPAKATTVGASLVHVAAVQGTDPVLLPVSASIPLEYGIWGAVGGTTVVSASVIQSVVNAWVVHDGWLGPQTNNLDCTGPSSPGCNGHRDAILSNPPLPGAQLYADVAVLPSTLSGLPAVSIAAQLIWVAP